MDNKKLGLIIIGISIVFSLFIYGLGSKLQEFQSDACTCSDSCADSCNEHEPPYLIYGSIAVIFSTLSLGVYLFFFEKSHQSLISKLKDDASVKSKHEKFELIQLGLNDDEKKILAAVRDQDGITQHTLGLRTDMHKSKLSIIVGMLEKKSLVKKVQSGKTHQVFLKVNLDAQNK
jgi:DNA-binding MarR family transcriptional regulator